MPSSSTVSVRDVSYRYDDRLALDGLTLDIRPNEIFALLGPNGSGKTTLFRLITTLMPLQQGAIQVMACDVRTEPRLVREQIGVVFQSPSIDLKLTARENLLCQAALYDLREPDRSTYVDHALEELGLLDREHERAETFSGGLRRRLDLARGILARPAVLILDEPTAALDPAARADVWRYLRSVRANCGTSVVFTTHLLEEADRADRLGIMDAGRLVACESPRTLKHELGSEILTIQALREPALLRDDIRRQLGVHLELMDHEIRLECRQAQEWLTKISQFFGERIQTITLSKPTLEDVFVHHTGHRFWAAAAADGATVDTPRMAPADSVVTAPPQEADTT